MSVVAAHPPLDRARRRAVAPRGERGHDRVHLAEPRAASAARSTSATSTRSRPTLPSPGRRCATERLVLPGRRAPSPAHRPEPRVRERRLADGSGPPPTSARCTSAARTSAASRTSARRTTGSSAPAMAHAMTAWARKVDKLGPAPRSLDRSPTPSRTAADRQHRPHHPRPLPVALGQPGSIPRPPDRVHMSDDRSGGSYAA